MGKTGALRFSEMILIASGVEYGTLFLSARYIGMITMLFAGIFPTTGSMESRVIPLINLK